MVEMYQTILKDVNWSKPNLEQLAASDRANNLRIQERVRLILDLFANGGYIHVANIEGDDLEFAYKATQNGVLSDSWSQMPPKKVTPQDPFYHLITGARYGRKSTDIGDVLELGDGTRYYVNEIGFLKLEK